MGWVVRYPAMVSAVLGAVMLLLLAGCGEEFSDNTRQGAIQLKDAAQDIAKNVTETVAKEQKLEEDRGKEPAPEETQGVENLPEKTYTADQAVDSIKEALDADYYNFSRDPTWPDFIRSSDLKYYTIHTLPEEKRMTTPEGFCGNYCARNWEDWKYFINWSNHKSLTPPLPESNFSREQYYREYLADRILINHTIIERSVKLDQGTVLEYQLISWRQDPFFTFKGAWHGTYLIYKVPCAENLTILLRPKWDVLKISLPSNDMASTYQTWEYYIEDSREKLQNASRRIMESCPDSKALTEGYDFPEYFHSEMLTYFWKTELQHFVNVTHTAKVGVKPIGLSGEKSAIDNMTITYTNHEEYDLDLPLSLRITVTPDDKYPTEYYDDEVIPRLRVGRTLNKSLDTKEIRFKDKAHVQIELYTNYKDALIRPFDLTVRAANATG